MSNVVIDNPTPPAPKNPDVNPVPMGQIANYSSYTDFNTTRTWLSDIRDFVGAYVANFFRMVSNLTAPLSAAGGAILAAMSGLLMLSQNGRGYRQIVYNVDVTEFGQFIPDNSSSATAGINIATLEAAETFAEGQVNGGVPMEVVLPCQGNYYIKDGSISGLGLRIRGNSANAPCWRSAVGKGAFDNTCTLKWVGTPGATMVYFESFNRGTFKNIVLHGNSIAGIAGWAGGTVYGSPGTLAASDSYTFEGCRFGWVKLGGGGTYGAFLVGSPQYMGSTFQSADAKWLDCDFIGEDPGAPGFTFAGMQAFGWATADAGNTKNFYLDRPNFLFCNVACNWLASGYMNVWAYSMGDVRTSFEVGTGNLTIIGGDSECGDVDNYTALSNAGGGVSVSLVSMINTQNIGFQAGSVGTMISGGFHLHLVGNIFQNASSSVSGNPTIPNPFKILTGPGAGGHSSIFSHGNWFMGCGSTYAPFYDATGSLAPLAGTYGGVNPFHVCSISDSGGTDNSEMLPLLDFNSGPTRFYGASVNGPFGLALTTSPTTTNLPVMSINAGSGNQVASLPSPSSTDNYTLWVQKSDSSSNTVTAAGVVLALQYDAVMLVWTGTAWTPIGLPVSATSTFAGTKEFTGQVGVGISPGYRFEVAGTAVGGALAAFIGSSCGSGDIVLYAAGPTLSSSMANFVQLHANVTGTLGGSFQNDNNTNAAACAQWGVNAGGASAGDPTISWTVLGATVWAMGIDNDDNDALKISASNQVGLGVGFDAIRIDPTTQVASFFSPAQFAKASSLTALSGGGQSGATALGGQVNVVSTVAADHDSAILPAPSSSFFSNHVVVFNAGAHILDVYPSSGAAIDALGANNPYSIAAGASREFWSNSTIAWLSK